MKTKLVSRRPLVAWALNRLRALPGFRLYPVLYVGSAVKAWQHRHEFASVRAYLMFVGHPRSGHSLVGSLLDAHPNVVVAHELDALRFVAAGYRREQLFSLVLEHSRNNALAGRRSWGYSYAVPGQWQGRHEALEVVGDKRGRKSTARIADDPQLLNRLIDVIRVPLKVVHVVRNPYDNIATMYRRGDLPLEQQVEIYFALAATVDRIAGELDDDQFYRVYLEDLVADAKGMLAGLCSFLAVPAEPDYVEACAAIVFPSPHVTRSEAPWTPELLATVSRQAATHPWLARYPDEE